MNHHITTGENDRQKNVKYFAFRKKCTHYKSMLIQLLAMNEGNCGKQCGFIVELLRSYGLDDTDLPGQHW